MVGRGGLGSAVSALAARTAQPLARLWQFVCARQDRFPPGAHRAGVGRRRIRQREEPRSHPNASPFREEKAFGSGARSHASKTSASAPSARAELQPLPLEASLPSIEDVNRGQIASREISRLLTDLP